MKNKLLIVFFIIMMLNIISSNFIEEKFGVIETVKAEERNIITRDDISKFRGKIVAGYSNIAWMDSIIQLCSFSCNKKRWNSFSGRK